MADVGRPTKYKEEYNELAYKLCLLGHTDEELAQFFEVHVSTIHQWKLDYPDFSDSIKNGKEFADIEIVQSLHNRARGMTLKKQVVKGEGAIVEVEDEIPPDTTAMIFWLKNRQPKKWRDKQVQEHEGEITVINTPLSDIFK